MRTTRTALIGGLYAKVTNCPPPPWSKMREQAHLQKFKEFRLGEFPWTSMQFGLNGEKGGWAWASPEQVKAAELLRQGRWETPESRRVEHPELPPAQLREEVPPLAQAVLAAHLRGRGGGYGMAPEQRNIPVNIRSQRPELDTARTDEPRTMHTRWAQYREVELNVRVADMGLSHQARRRLEAMVPEEIHNGVLQLKCDAYEDFWDNYEWVNTKLNQILADARKADLDPKYWPMEQYKIREPRGRLRAAQSLKGWHSLQDESLKLGRRFSDLKERGVESVTAFQLYETPARKVLAFELAKEKGIEVRLTGLADGYNVDTITAALSQVRRQAVDMEQEREEDMPDDLELVADPSQPSGPVPETEDDTDDDTLSGALDAAVAPAHKRVHKKKPATDAAARDELQQLLSDDFAAPDDADDDN